MKITVKLGIETIVNIFFLILFIYESFKDAPITTLIVPGIFYITSCIRIGVLEITKLITSDEDEEN